MPATSGECEPMSEMLSGAEILCRALVDAGVEVIFGYPGGAIMPFYHALPDHPRLRHILVRHEQAAAHAADGYARASGRVGVCVATSGPGATNLVTGLAAAHMRSEEHTSELQSRLHLVCRLLLEKKKKRKKQIKKSI